MKAVRILPVVGALLLLGGAGLPARAAPAAQEVRLRRAAFGRAINARQLRTAMAFVHPQFRLVSEGNTGDRRLLQGVLVELFKQPGYRVIPRIRRLSLSGNVARLTVSETVSFRGGRSEATSLETWRKMGGRWLLTRSVSLM
jgi:hypothetical protein